MKLCPCGRLGRGFGWQDPIKRGERIPACCMAHLNWIHDRNGDMTELNQRENEAIYEFVKENHADLKRMDFNNADVGEFCEFFVWAYAAISEKMIPY